MARRVALLIAVGQSLDPLLRQLRAPAHDVGSLEGVLRDVEVGGFTDVRTIIDRPRHEIEEAIEDAFADRKPDDVVLAYFTCHGVKDLHGRLFFAASNTRSDRLASTAVSSVFVNEQMEHSRAGAKVALLDCCYSGAFAKGLAPKGALDGDLAAQICGRGTYVITATNSLEYAYEGTAVTRNYSVSSSFTEFLVEGLRSGRADWDRDGRISPEDLYWYLDKEMRSAGKPQTPTSFSSGVQGAVYLARSRHQPVDRQPTAALDASARADVERHLRDLEIRYTSIREVLPSGGRRTALLDDIPAQAGALADGAERVGLLASRLESFATDDEGARIVTLALCDRALAPSPAVVDATLDGIRNSRSAFEQFWALCAASSLFHELPDPDRAALQDAAQTVIDSGKAASDSNRMNIARAIATEQLSADRHRKLRRYAP